MVKLKCRAALSPRGARLLSSLWVRSMRRGITDKGEISPYYRGYAVPSNTIKSSFLLNKYFSIICIILTRSCMSMSCQHAQSIHVCFSPPKEEEGARHVAGFELPAPLLLLIESYL